MKRFFHVPKQLAILAALTLFAAAQAVTLPLPSSNATSSITVTDLKRHLSFLASDELGGRYTFSQGNRIAARYLATQLEAYGYHGAARDGSFLQKVPLAYRGVDVTKSGLTLHTTPVKKEFKYNDDFITEQLADAEVKGELVFVGYGKVSSAPQRDDYEGLNVKGKIVVALNGNPDFMNAAGDAAAATLEQTAAERGAVGLILISAPDVWFYSRASSASEQLSLPPRANANGKILPTLQAGPNLIKAIAAALNRPAAALTHLDGKPVKAATLNLIAEWKLSVKVKDAPLAQNVVGVLAGTDAKLKDEYVVISAHYDHLETTGDGQVYNGADDDGSGTVSVLEIAQAFALERPKRSVLVIFHTGEELGLYGSEYNADYQPVVPLAKLVADLNIDMVGRSRPEGDTDARDKELTDKNSLYIIGSDKLSTEFHRLNEQTNAETQKLHFDYLYNDENHPQRFYYRSDHYNYAKHGIPIIFYFTGVHRDYHQPTDDVEKIDFEKMERIDRMIFAVGWRIANLDHRLVVDKKPAANSRMQ
ncbi:MAG: M28 family peptidase [Acidobacteria bacterium]|nr:M28 family peptidase [Acidobacteriota bacterium]